MDITVYLPDELGQRAKLAGLNLSRLLRDAASAELARRAALKATTADAQVQRLALERDGRAYLGRFTGCQIAQHGQRDLQLFATDDGRVLAYDGERRQLHAHDPAEQDRAAWLSTWLGDDEDALLDAAAALGELVEVNV